MFFLFSTSLQPWAACWFTHTASEAQRPREMVPSTPLFFPPFFLHPMSSSHCHHWQFLCSLKWVWPKSSPSTHTSSLTRHFVWRGCYIHMILWHTKGSVPLCQDANACKNVLHISFSFYLHLSVELLVNLCTNNHYTRTCFYIFCSLKNLYFE